jgi:hypothetical protein
MKQSESFSNSSCTDQIHLAERELSAFTAAVAELFGAEQARVSAEDWLDELELMDASPRSTRRDRQAVTIAPMRQLRMPRSPRLSMSSDGWMLWSTTPDMETRPRLSR